MSKPQPKPEPSCPICGKPTTASARPFCSARCANIDLSRWLSGAYAIAGGNDDADEDGDASMATPASGGPSPSGRRGARTDYDDERG